MSVKEKILSLLFGHQKKATNEAVRAGPTTQAEEVLEVSVTDSPLQNPAYVELPQGHALNILYDQRRKETGYLPTPRLCLDENDILPPELIQREKLRLRTALTTFCSARLREAKGKGPKAKTKSQKELEEELEGPPVLDAFPYLFLSADKLYAWLIVFPPMNLGEELSRDLLYQALVTQDITYGVDRRLIDHLSHDDRRYFTLYLVAKGTPAFDGRNGNIIDNFPRTIERVLEVDEYDQVDYTALNLIYNAEEGQEICRLIEPTEGEPGRTVTDQEIPAKSGKPVPLPKGRNTEISEDGTQLLASIAGHVEFSGRSFQVKPVLDIPGNVDFSVGDLNFLGDINIQGDVLSGFTVRAMGNIHVGGVVEAGSTVEAGGDLVVVKGILGDGSTTIQSQRSIFSKYIENSVICVRENVQTDCIINSHLYCGGEILVQSGRGSIMGGRIWAAHKISAKTIGSLSECKTSILLGGSPCINFEREAVQQEVSTLETNLEKLECQPDSPVKNSLLSKTKLKLTTAELKLRQLEEILEARAAQPAEEKQNGKLECGIAYPRTEIRIGEEMLRLQQISRNCVVKMVQGEILLM